MLVAPSVASSAGRVQSPRGRTSRGEYAPWQLPSGPASPVRGYAQKTGTSAALSINNTTDWTTAAPQSGDLIVVMLMPNNVGSKGGSLSAPTGYASYYPGGYWLNGPNIYTRAASGTSADAFSITQGGGMGDLVATAVCLAGKTLDAESAYGAFLSTGGSPFPITVPSITTGHANAYIITPYYLSVAGGTLALPSNQTLIGSLYNPAPPNDGPIGFAWEYQATQGASGTRTAHYSESTEYAIPLEVSCH